MSDLHTLQFRLATLADADALASLVESAYRGDSSRRGWTTEADLLDGRRTDAHEIAAQIGGAERGMLLAERAGQTLACCFRERQGQSAHFGMFAVRPDLQGAGVGAALLEQAEQQAVREWRSLRMRMAVIDLREDLIAWYLRRGYRRTGEYAPFPYGDERFGRPRRPDLRFEYLEKSLGDEAVL